MCEMDRERKKPNPIVKMKEVSEEIDLIITNTLAAERCAIIGERCRIAGKNCHHAHLIDIIIENHFGLDCYKNLKESANQIGVETDSRSGWTVQKFCRISVRSIQKEIVIQTAQENQSILERCDRVIESTYGTIQTAIYNRQPIYRKPLWKIM